jgi:membrane protein YqaA with SNARE-associated domain
METGVLNRNKDEADSKNCVKANESGQKLKRFLLTLLLIAGTIGVCIVLIYFRGYVAHIRYFGYPSAFIFGFIAGCSLPFPLPYVIVTFSLGGVLNPALVGLASGAGAGIGGTLFYIFGASGSHLLPRFSIFKPCPDPTEPGRARRLYDWLHRWTHQRGSLVVFLMSAIFNPVFAPMAIAIGALRFGFRRFFLWCTLGNLVKSMFIAYCGYFGLGAILRWLGG